MRDLVGKAEDAVDCGDIRSANDVWVQTTSVVMPPNTLVAINQEHARGGDRVRDGDEVAFLPPVTGG